MTNFKKYLNIILHPFDNYASLQATKKQKQEENQLEAISILEKLVLLSDNSRSKPIILATEEVYSGGRGIYLDNSKILYALKGELQEAGISKVVTIFHGLSKSKPECNVTSLNKEDYVNLLKKYNLNHEKLSKILDYNNILLNNNKLKN